MLKTAVSFTLGVASWPVMEYVLHRYSFHGAENIEGADNEHLEHHRHPEYYNEGTYKESLPGAIELMLPVTAAFGAALTPFVGAKAAFAYASGLGFRFLIYEKEHLEAHTTAPKNDREAKLKKHHLIHHFKFPKDNFGVCTTVIDDIMGTSKEVDVLHIPARMAPKWLQDNPEAYAKDYKLIGLERLKEAGDTGPKKTLKDRKKLKLADLIPNLKAG